MVASMMFIGLIPNWLQDKEKAKQQDREKLKVAQARDSLVAHNAQNAHNQVPDKEYKGNFGGNGTVLKKTSSAKQYHAAPVPTKSSGSASTSNNNTSTSSLVVQHHTNLQVKKQQMLYYAHLLGQESKRASNFVQFMKQMILIMITIQLIIVRVLASMESRICI